LGQDCRRTVVTFVELGVNRSEDLLHDSTISMTGPIQW
jgi:hypothetical protein